MQAQIVRVTTSDGLYLHGFFQPGARNKTALLHIHGFEGNFYENYFLDVISNTLKKSNITWLPVNTRGNGKETAFNTTDGREARIGARYELLEQAYIDIDAWVEFLQKEGFNTICLMGHSLGTMKAVRYLSEGKFKHQINKLILLSPFDKKALIEPYTHSPIELMLEKAKEMIKKGRGEELITSEFDTISLSYNSYVSWYKQDDFGRCFEFCTKNYVSPVLKKIQIPTKIIVGSKDEFFHLSNPDNPQEAMEIMLNTIPDSQGVIIPEAVHSFSPHEEILAKEILEFI